MKVTFLEPLGISQEELKNMAARELGDRVETEFYDTRIEDVPGLIERSRDADCVVLSNFKYGREVMSRCPNLKMICVAFTGVDHVDVEYCRERGITVCNCAGYSTVAVADLVFGFVISLARNLIPCDSAVRREGTKAGLVGYELEGKKFVKKRNHLNGFKRTYEGRYEYRRLCCSDRHEVWQFMERWRQHREEVGAMELSLDYEVAGIHDILKNCSNLYVRMAGVYIDGQLEAFTIGSLNVRENMAVIHIEKANPEIRGLYQFINQQFLINEFPEAELVNREDDVGMEGLRKAKMSYYPIGFARKYMVRER